MIKTEKLLDFLELVLYSGYLKYEKPLSTIIVATAESGKTLSLEKFKQNNGIMYLTDCTGYGLTKEVLPKIDSGIVKHIIIPDLLKPLSRKADTVSSFITFMNALIEEGVAEISTYAQGMTYRKTALKCGLITSITRDELNDQRHKWTSMGFLSRSIPFSFKYSQSTVADIFEYIMTGKYKDEDYIKLKFPKNLKEITIKRRYAEKFMNPAISFAQSNEVYGFRFQKGLQVLAQSNALRRKKGAVSKLDVNKIMDLLPWINLEYNSL